MGWIWSTYVICICKDVALRSRVGTINLHLKATEKEGSQPRLQLVLAPCCHRSEPQICTSATNSETPCLERASWQRGWEWCFAQRRPFLSYSVGGWVNGTEGQSEWDKWFWHKNKVKRKKKPSLTSRIPSYPCSVWALLAPVSPPWMGCSWALATFITIHSATLEMAVCPIRGTQ